MADAGPRDQAVLSDTQRLPKKTGPVYLDGAVVRPSILCQDTSSEPNNSGATATSLTHHGLITGWEICYPGDMDQYALKVDPGKKLTVTVAFKHAKGDLDVALMAPDGFIQGARGVSDNETVTATNTSSARATYILGVWGFNLDTNTYDVNIEIK